MRGPAVSGPLSWSQVFPFGHVGCIFSKSVDYRDILLRAGGSGIYPPETWRFPDVGELLYYLADDLCTSGVWSNIALHTRMALPVCFYFFRLLSTSHWVSHSQRFTMSLNVQAGLCFPLGEPLSAFSGRHSMTRRLFLNLLCHGHVDGSISGYMARKSSSKVVRTLDLKPGSWDPELEAGTRNPEILEPKEKGGSPVTSYWLSGMTAVFPGTPRLAPPAFGVCQSCKPGRKMLCLPEDLFSFLYVAELLQGPALQWRAEPAGTKDCRNVIHGRDLEPAGSSRDS
ncbi:hypothetical protein F2Q69_00023309 [Brassica cretica]|uniref:Uncharacterized protein n=1 Tax=Brassica cretica TaxID=69181 RepID=A0A8S9QIR6_BRACR|nr:hypothetical protein F2Q69_00023309 [Brassica cretica]